MKYYIYILLLFFLICNCGDNPAGYKMPNGWFEQDIEANENKLFAIDFVDFNYGWLIGDNGIAFYTFDSGQNWLPLSVPEAQNWYSIKLLTRNVGWLCGEKGMYYTANRGLAWKHHNNLSRVRKLLFIDSQTGWLINDDGNIMKTTDKGENWNINYTTSDSLYGLYFIDTNYGWVCGKNGLNLYTSNAGESWNTGNIDTTLTTSNLYDIEFINQEKGWITGENGLLLHSTDSGANWSKVDTDITQNLYSLNWVDDKLALVVGEDGIIISTIDAGTTWQDTTLTDIDLYDIEFSGPYDGWTIGDKGTILRFHSY